MKTSDLSAFTRHYLVAALWSSTDDKGTPLDSKYSLEDFTPEALERATADCDAFQSRAEDLLSLAYESDDYLARENHPDNDGGGVYALAGHDFWLSRNGHGVGFFDRGQEPFWRGLQNTAKAFHETNIEVGDDGRLHFF